MDFEFIQDQRFKELLLRDYQELITCLENKSSKAVLILAGSIIEAILVEYFLQNIPNGKTEDMLLRMVLGNLIDLAEKEGLLTTREKNLASVVQDYRNLIHPGRQIREKEKYDFEAALIAKSLVSIIADAIRRKFLFTNYLSASEVIDKLKNDWDFRSIYSKIILKLKQAERIKLINLLLTCEVENKEQWDAFKTEGPIPDYPTDYLEGVKSLVTELKPLLQPEIILDKLTALSVEIERGEKLKAFALFNFFHEDVDKLHPEEQEIIAIYFLSMFSSLLKKCNGLAYERTYSTIGRCIKSKHGINAFKDFTVFCIVHFTKKGIEWNSEMDLYEQAFNSLKEEHREIISEHINDFLFGENSNPPKEIIEAFVNEAYSRGIISRKEEEFKF